MFHKSFKTLLPVWPTSKLWLLQQVTQVNCLHYVTFVDFVHNIFMGGGYTSTSFFQEGDKCYFSDTTVSSISVTSYYYTVTNGGKTFENLNKTGPNLYKYWATTTWCPLGPLRSRKSPHICPFTQLFQATKSTLYPRGRKNV